MRDKVTLSEKCIELATRVGDEEDEPAAPDSGDGFDKALQIAANMLWIGAEGTYRSFETLIKRRPESATRLILTTMYRTTRRSASGIKTS